MTKEMHAIDNSITVKRGHCWADFCSLRAGLGKVQLLEPANQTALQKILDQMAQSQPSLLLGRGTNMVGSDSDDLTVLRLPAKGEMAQIKSLGDGRFAVGCGISLTRMLLLLARAGFGGYAGLSGIPGSLGGALAMNAGARGQEIASMVLEIHGYHLLTGQQWHWGTAAGGWSYRTSPAPPAVILTSATLQLPAVDPEQEKSLIADELCRRQATTPAGHSAGSVFRNPSPDLPAGKLLEQAGCKNMHQGVFTVSQQHANWIVNQSGKPGTAKDCRELMQRMADAVAQMHDIHLQCEWKVIEQ